MPDANAHSRRARELRERVQIAGHDILRNEIGHERYASLDADQRSLVEHAMAAGALAMLREKMMPRA